MNYFTSKPIKHYSFESTLRCVGKKIRTISSVRENFKSWLVLRVKFHYCMHSLSRVKHIKLHRCRCFKASLRKLDNFQMPTTSLRDYHKYTNATKYIRKKPCVKARACRYVYLPIKQLQPECQQKQLWKPLGVTALNCSYLSQLPTPSSILKRVSRDLRMRKNCIHFRINQDVSSRKFGKICPSDRVI